MVTGSRLYGTNIETSDTDYIGVFYQSYRDLLGSVNIKKELNLSHVSKMENGKNDSEAIDRKFYNLANYLKLLEENNPNILEMVFVNKENIIYQNILGEMLLKNKHLFPYKGLVKRFIGYAKGQLHKMVIKSDSYNQMREIVKYLEENVDGKTVLVELTHDDNFLSEFDAINERLMGKDMGNGKLEFAQRFFTIGDINIPVNVSVKDTINRLNTRISKAGHRKELVLKYGMDVKFAMHTIRLLSEAKQLLTTGEIIYPLSNREVLLKIRNGEHTPDYVIDMSNDMIIELDELFLSSTLRSKLDKKGIIKLKDEMIDIISSSKGW